MLAAESIKTIVLEAGADQCGIASTERFDDAPDGFHPCDVYSKCKSLVVFKKQIPPEGINAENPIT